MEEPIDFAVVAQKDENLANRNRKSYYRREKGLVSKQYEVILENGKEVSRNVINEQIVKR